MSPYCDQSTQTQLTIANAGNEDPKFRCKKMEGDEGLNTVECLRGRLLAQRQESRVANEQALSLGNKLVELEKKLRDEMELRGKAEKKLKKLNKKLQSMKLFSVSEDSVQLPSPEKSESSCGRSLASSSASRDSEAMRSVSEPSAPMANGYDSHGSDNSTTNSNSDRCPSHQDLNSQDLKNDENSSTSRSSSKDSSCRDLKSGSATTEYEDDNRECIDNSLALVPVNIPMKKTEARKKARPVHESVVEALDALRHAREKLLFSMGTRTRHMIQVGPT